MSSLAWTSATAGWGTVEKNESVGGNALTVGGKTYASGIGTHAVSTIVYALAGGYTTFAATVGVDGEVKGAGEVDFKVVGDGTTLFDSGVLTDTQATTFSVSVAGVKALQLVATNGVANSIDYDHADWAGATLTTVPTTAPAAPTGLSATAVTSSSVKLAWTAPAGTVASYAVDRSTDGTTWTTVTTAIAGSATTWTDPTALSPSTKYGYRIRAANAGGTSPNSAIATVTTLAKQAATALSALTWVSATAGWGTVQKNLSVGGNAITVAGTTYATGIGTHAPSTIVYNLAGAYTGFTATVGIDGEETGKAGHAEFEVYGDGVLLFDSGLLTTGQSAAVAVSLVGVKQLSLVVAAAPDGDISYAHADWAGAQLLA